MVVWKGGSYSLLCLASNHHCLEPVLPPEQGELNTLTIVHVPLNFIVLAELYCSLQLVVQPADNSVLEQLNKFSLPSAAGSHPHILEDLGLGLEGEGTRDEPHEPSPFSTKKDMYSGKSGAQVNVLLTCSLFLKF